MEVPAWATVCLFLWATLAASPVLAQAKKYAPKKKTPPSQQFKGYGLPAPVKEAPKLAMQVAPVVSSREAAKKGAAKIDALVEANLKKQGLEPNPDAAEHVFLRRAYLDIVGTIPNLFEYRAYALTKDDGTRREKLVDTLLNSPGYVSHMFNYWSAILRLVDRPNNNMMAYAYRDWVKDQLRINRPYDQWVFDMLTAEGKIWENPAVGYVLRDDGMPLVHVDNTVRVFLGTQIGCAQCHDHPFDHWTQKEFYQLAAFTSGIATRDGNGSAAFKNGNPVNRIREELRKNDPTAQVNGSLNQLLQANLFRVSFDTKRGLKLPHDYAYSNGKPNQVVEPAVLWGTLPEQSKQQPKRVQFASWLTSPENPRFAKTLANRLWKKVMGVGLIEPVDDIRDDSPCANAELLTFLSDELVRLKFNQKEFLRMVLYTNTYRRTSSPFDPSEAEFYHYPGPTLRRMTAEQVWDSILSIAVYNAYPYELPNTEQFARVVSLDLATVNAGELAQHASQFDAEVGPTARNRTMNTAAYRRQVLARASELPLPLPADHFIRQFGQCDRETISGDSLDPTVPQILTMFNGPFTHMMLEKGSMIYDNILRAANPRDQLEVMFISILQRPPSSADREIALREMKSGDPAMGYGNIIWALINTREFLFVQ
ncbi:MAG: DUF1549 domain-containing protein [Pirellulaceae bacterium]|nr:DUF1549 domain-containing protein [Pirellulaceae bacterium]